MREASPPPPRSQQHRRAAKASTLHLLASCQCVAVTVTQCTALFQSSVHWSCFLAAASPPAAAAASKEKRD
jgi:hypothetical protein